MFSLTAAISHDGGYHWEHLKKPPHHLVATVAHAYDESQMWFGFGDSGGILRNHKDNYFYTTGHNRASVGGQANGTCLMRTDNLTDPGSWRGWNGSAFSARFVDPYTLEPGADVSPFICHVLEDGPMGLPRGHNAQPTVNQGLTWSTHLNQFIAVLWNTRHDPTIGSGAPFVFALSDDLISWSAVAPLPLPVSFAGHGGLPNGSLAYPSLLDPAAQHEPGQSFDVVGRTPWLYFALANPQGTPQLDHWDALVRVPLDFGAELGLKSDDEARVDRSRITTANCSFAAATTNGSCVAFTGLAQLPRGVWPVRCSSDNRLTVFVATPCHNATAVQTTCTSFVTATEAPAFQQSESGHTCYALGDLARPTTTTLIDPNNASKGVLITYTGGTPTNGRARVLRYRLTCDPSSSASAGPTAEAQVGPQADLVYGVTWPTPHACSTAPAPPAVCATPPPPPHAPVPVPTAQQLAWQDLEVGAMLGFNMQSHCLATSAAGRSDQPCLTFDGATGSSAAALRDGRANGWIPSPETAAQWNPAELDTDKWAAAAKSFGANYVMLVAQHMAGFSLWDTKAHNFSISHTAYKGGGQDIVKDMVASCKKYGLKLGFFYSVHYNWWLGVDGYKVGHPRIDHALPNLTQTEFIEIAKTQLTELAARFGPEGPVEIW